MKLKEQVKKFQQGGPMPGDPAAGGAPAPEGGAPAEGGQDPLMQLAQAAMQAVQTQDCNAAMQVCEGFISLLQQSQGGQEAQPQGQPVFKAGGKLAKRIP